VSVVPVTCQVIIRGQSACRVDVFFLYFFFVHIDVFFCLFRRSF
jgi:hypothetical protein